MPRARSLFPAVLTLALAAPAAAGTRARGANVHSSNGTELDSAVAMHLGWVRIDVVWKSVEPANGAYAWEELDRVVQACRSRGLRIYATLGSTPAWACRMGVPPVEDACVPQEGFFGRFASAVATRYRGAISVYSIWNEPDMPANYQGEPLSYVDALLVPGATAIRAADPLAKVAAPDLTGSWSGNVRSQSSFYDAIALRGAQGLVDIVSQHVYEEGLLRGPDGILHKFFDGDFLHRSLLYAIDRSVLAGKEVWITEFGFAGGGDSGNGDDVARTFELFGPRERVTALFDYELTDCDGCVTPNLGLLRKDLSWKPGAGEMARRFEDLDPTPPAFRDRFDGPWSAALWRWTFPDGGAAVRDGRLENAVPAFRAVIVDLAATDFEVSSTVRITDDLGSGFNWVGIAGRTSASGDPGTGYLALLRANGDAVLFCAKSGLALVARTGKDAKAHPVRLALRATGDRVSLAVDGVELLAARDATWTKGSVGLRNSALGSHEDVIVRTSPAQVVPRAEPVLAPPHGPVSPHRR